MSKTISIHSFRGGTGKSNVTANLAVLLADLGLRVGVVDTDIQSPGIHVLFGLDEAQMDHSLNDYLWGRCPIADAAYDVTPAGMGSGEGKVYLIPSSIRAGEIARVLREGYDIALLNAGFRQLTDALDLDLLLIDTHPGLNEETLLSIAISDTLIIILRPDQQDFQGTDVTVAVARRLEVPRMMLGVNKVPKSLDAENLKAQVEQTYGCDVGALLPHSEKLMLLASSGIFALEEPTHPITQTLRGLAATLANPA